PAPAGYAYGTIRGLPVGESSFRVVAHGVSTSRGSYIVYVAGSLGAVAASTDSLARLLLVGLPLLLLLVGGTTWVVSGMALRPVEAIRRAVESIGAADPHRSLPEPSTDDGIVRLAWPMNAIL